MAKITALSFIVPVRDIEKAVRFYSEAFGLQEVFRADQIAFVGIPGTDTALGLLHDPERAGSGPQNIGMHVDHAVGLDAAIRDIEAAGGSVVERPNTRPASPSRASQTPTATSSRSERRPRGERPGVTPGPGGPARFTVEPSRVAPQPVVLS